MHLPAPHPPVLVRRSRHTLSGLTEPLVYADTRGLASQVPDPQGVTSSHAGTTTSLDSDAQAAEAIVGRPSSTGNGRDKPLPTPGGHTSASRDGGLNPGGSSRRDIGNEQRDVDDPEGDGIRETESGGAQAKPGLDTKVRVSVCALSKTSLTAYSR